MNRKKRNEGIELLKRMNTYLTEKIANLTNESEIKKLKRDIATNLVRIEKLKGSEYDFSKVRKPDDLDNLPIKPNPYDDVLFIYTK